MICILWWIVKNKKTNNKTKQKPRTKTKPKQKSNLKISIEIQVGWEVRRLLIWSTFSLFWFITLYAYMYWFSTQINFDSDKCDVAQTMLQINSVILVKIETLGCWPGLPTWLLHLLLPQCACMIKQSKKITNDSSDVITISLTLLWEIFPLLVVPVAALGLALWENSGRIWTSW